ncbi:MAG: HEPN domain-containing protein [Candidatus Kapabacteria bacterium]|nr:HEPN domain-containing protein [Candidatus Kapabacteria bacterium]
MEIKEHIEYWIKASNEDYEVCLLLIESKKYLHALFLAHLSLEKLVKAHWVGYNENSVPPKIHNLVSLIKQTETELSDDQLVFLTIMNDFQIQGRYPDYKLKVHKLLANEYVDELMERFKEVRACLLASFA